MQNNVTQLKNRIDIVDFFNKHFDSIKSIGGSTYRINPCPFCGHNDCFTIFKIQQNYHCFSCAQHGDIINFEMKKNRITFKDAINFFSNGGGLS